MTTVSLSDKRARQYAALAPLLSAAGAFIHPAASIALPFFLFLFLRNRAGEFEVTAALRAADFAFSVNLWLIVATFGVMTLAQLEATASLVNQYTMTLITVGILLYFFGLLILAMVNAIMGKPFRYMLSFRLAERVLFRKD